MHGVTGRFRNDAFSDYALRPAVHAAATTNGGAIGDGSRDTLIRTRRRGVEPQYQSNKESWDEYQRRHCEWRGGACLGKPPENEGKSPPLTPGQIATSVVLSILGGGPLEPRPTGMGAEPGGASGVPLPSRPATPMDTSPPPSRPATPMDTSPPPSRPATPMDTSPPPSRPATPMDTSPPPSRPATPMDTSPPRSRSASPVSEQRNLSPSSARRDSVESTHSSTRPKSADEANSPNQDLNPEFVPPGMRINEIGFLEKKAFPRVYRVDSGLNRAAILEHGFEPSSHFGGIKKMISGDALIVSETLEGARAFGDSEFGAGHYDLYEIKTKGLEGASLKDNVYFNTDFTARQLGRTPSALKKMAPREVAEGALEFREAHIDAAAGDPARIRLIERGMPRPQTPPDSDGSLGAGRPQTPPDRGRSLGVGRPQTPPDRGRSLGVGRPQGPPDSDGSTD
jgi:hypothetical protein